MQRLLLKRVTCIILAFALLLSGFEYYARMSVTASESDGDGYSDADVYVESGGGDESGGDETEGGDETGGGDETEGDETEGDETEGDETEGDETEGDETEGDETEGDETEGDETEGDETEGDETEGDETEGDETEGDETEGDETEGDETEGDETEGDETEGDETEGDETEGDETEGDETEGDEDLEEQDGLNPDGAAEETGAIAFEFEPDSEYLEAPEYSLLQGVSAVDENGNKVNGIRVEDNGGFDKNDPICIGTQDNPMIYSVTYAVEHPETGETFTDSRTVYVAAPEDNSDVIFTFEPLVVDINDLGPDCDINAILLDGITAVDENGDDLTEFITVKDGGGFAAYVEELNTRPAGFGGGPVLVSGLAPLMEVTTITFGEDGDVITGDGSYLEASTDEDGYVAPKAFSTQVTYAVEHPVSGVEFVSEPRDLQVNGMMQIMPMALVTGSAALQQQINNASAGSTINIELSSSFTFTNAVSIDKNLTIKFTSTTGNDITLYTPTPSNSGIRHFTVEPGVNVTMEFDGKVILHGNRADPGNDTVGTDFGGGILSGAASLTLKNARIYNTRAHDSGGAVWAYEGKLSIEGGEFKNSTAPYYGGAIYIEDGTLEITNSEITNNLSQRGGAVAVDYGSTATINNVTLNKNRGYYGGAFYVNQSNTLTVNNSTISNGVGIIEGGGGIWTEGTVNIDASVIKGNQAVNYGGGFVVTPTGKLRISNGTQIIENGHSGGIYTNVGYGGGIYLRGTLEITGTGNKISNNQAQAGGGIHIDASGVTKIGAGLEISENKAIYRGGGVFSDSGGGGGIYAGSALEINGSLISGNTALVGGGIAAPRSDLTVNSGTISGNIATTVGINSASFGGGICCNGELTINGGEIIGNSARVTGGNTSSWADGGGIASVGLEPNSQVLITGGTIQGNWTEHSNVTQQKQSSGGGIYAYKLTIAPPAGKTVLISNNGRNSSGETTTWQGGGIKAVDAVISGDTRIIGNSAISSGGGICSLENPETHALNTLTITGGIIQNNWTTGATGYGGGICAIDGESSITPPAGATVVISGNGKNSGGQVTTQNGGGIFVDEDAPLNISGDVTISSNAAEILGGGIYTESALTITGGATITGNGKNAQGEVVTQYGGGIYAVSTVATTIISGTNTVISDNHARQGGGGIYSACKELRISGSKVSGNRSLDLGGGIYLSGSYAAFNMFGGEVSGNIAASGGGAYSNMVGSIYVNGTKFTSNTAEQRNGGGIHTYKTPEVSFEDATFTLNSAGRSGGAMSITTQEGVSCLAEIIGGEISNNTATLSGGGIYTDTLNNTSMQINASNVAVKDNTSQYGGGVYASGILLLSGNVVISGNTATADGGGIYMTAPKNLLSANTVKFSNNTAQSAYWIEQQEGTLQYLGVTSANIIAHALANAKHSTLSAPPVTIPASPAFTYAYNNYDVNYVGLSAANLDVIFKIISLDGVAGITTGPDSHVQWPGSANATTKLVTQPSVTNPSGKGGYPEYYNAPVWYREADYNATTNTFTGTPWNFATDTVNSVGTTVLVAFDNVAWDNASAVRTLNHGVSLHTTSAKFADILVRQSFSLSSVLSIPASRILTYRSIPGTEVLITSAESNHHLNITGGTVNLTFDKVTLNGNKPANGGRINIEGGADVTLNNAVIQNCKNDNGGGIRLSGGQLTIQGGEIRNNEATAVGGGIYANGNVTIQSGSIKGNQQTVSSYSSSGGGGIHMNSGRLIIQGGVISENTALFYGGGVHGLEGTEIIIQNGTIQNCTAKDGGGIYTNGNVIMNDGIISGNIATGESASGGGICTLETGNITINGGTVSGNMATNAGIHSAGGGGLYSLGDITITGGNIIGNYVRSTNASSTTANSHGGGILSIGPDSQLLITGGTIQGNWTECPNLAAADQSDGGGIYAREVTIAPPVGKTVLISNNGKNSSGAVSTWSGGGIYAVVSLDISGDVTISQNVATKYGGGINIANGELTLKGSKITNNTAMLCGGGIYVGSAGKITISDATQILRNGLAGSGYDITAQGGGIYLRGTLEILDSGNKISDNQAQAGGGMYIDASGLTKIGAGLEISGNQAIYRSPIYSGSGAGGGIYAWTPLEINGCLISGNTALNGGGIDSVAAELTINSGTISDNTAVAGADSLSFGGGICSSGKLTINGGEIIGNISRVTAAGTAASYAGGGGIASIGTSLPCEVVITGGTIQGNWTEHPNVTNPIQSDGGGIYAYKLTIAPPAGKTVLISNNGRNSSGETTTWQGGGIKTVESLKISGDTRITGNSAVHSGGGICSLESFETYQPNSLTITGGTIQNNWTTGANSSGGGIYAVNGEPSIAPPAGAAVVISGNGKNITSLTTTQNGGGIYASGYLTISGDVTISGNAVTADGGGVYMTRPTRLAVATGVKFSNNTAQSAYWIEQEEPTRVYLGTTTASIISYANVNVKPSTLSAPPVTTPVSKAFTYAYNNFDVNYVGEKPTNPDPGAIVTFKIISLDGVPGITASNIEWTGSANPTTRLVTQPSVSNPSGISVAPISIYYKVPVWYREADYNATTNTFTGTPWNFATDTADSAGTTVLVAFDNVIWDQASAERTLAHGTSALHSGQDKLEEILVRQSFTLTAALSITEARDVHYRSIPTTAGNATIKTGPTSGIRHFNISGGGEVGLAFVANGSCKVILDGGWNPSETYILYSSGGISITGAGTDVVLTSATIQNCKVSSSNGDAAGGAVYNAGGDLGIVSSKISESFAYSISPGNHFARGGGIYNVGGELAVINSEISDNWTKRSNNVDASGDGGGIYSTGDIRLQFATISRNETSYNGAGIYCTGNLTSFGGNTIEGNWNASGGGGGICSAGTTSTLTLIDGDIIRNNRAEFGGFTSHLRGGSGIWIAGKLVMSGGEISGNGVGGTYTREGGGIRSVNNTADAILITGGTITGNVSNGYDGGGIYTDGANSKITVAPPAGKTVIISGNGKEPGGQVINQNGGGIYANGKLDISGDATISGNAATANGGGIYMAVPTGLTVATGAKFSNNTAQNAYWIEQEDPTFQYLGITTANILAHAQANVKPSTLSAQPVTVPASQAFTYAYNNYDVNYVGTKITNPVVAWSVPNLWFGIYKKTLFTAVLSTKNHNASDTAFGLTAYANTPIVVNDADTDWVVSVKFKDANEMAKLPGTLLFRKSRLETYEEVDDSTEVEVCTSSDLVTQWPDDDEGFALRMKSNDVVTAGLSKAILTWTFTPDI